MSALGDAALSVAVGLAFCVSIENGEDALSAVMPKRPPAAECPELSHMCCRTLVEEPDCVDGGLACRPGFEACEWEDGGP